MHLPSLKEIKSLYDEGANVMHWFRQMESSELNSLAGILVSYDLQAGSYVRLLKEQPGSPDTWSGIRRRWLRSWTAIRPVQ